MAEPILLLRLEGPMQSWGTRSRWDVRDTGREPTKSGVIGLIGCAMGFERDDSALERLDRSLRFGVRIDCAGVISTDYHTVTGYHRTAAGEYKHRGASGRAKTLAKAKEFGEATIVSLRDYLHDANFLVALDVWPKHRSDNSGLLERIAASLGNPKWPLYLGRKSCIPSRPLVHRCSLTDTYPDLESALREAAWVTPHWVAQTPSSLEAWIECADGDVERQDAIRINQLRFYGFRRCRRIDIDTQKLPRRVP